MTDDLLRAVIHDPAALTEFDALVAERHRLAKRLPWNDEGLMAMVAINRRLVALATAPSAVEQAA